MPVVVGDKRFGCLGITTRNSQKKRGQVTEELVDLSESGIGDDDV